ncbi:MAG TPA: NADH-quinone oxidoreductase subunit I [Methanosarcinaceae archaeon]|nr:NADH-quinone oxidoreductase subunit I [Methanosarcinaceae archaeon]
MVIKNMIRAFKTVYTPSVTRLYPEVPTELTDRFRGLQKLDKDKCIGCGICANTCPNNAIKIVRDRRWFPAIDIGHCMFCGLCIDQCPQDALSSTKIYTTELVTWDRHTLLFTPAMLAREVPLKGEGDE